MAAAFQAVVENPEEGEARKQAAWYTRTWSTAAGGFVTGRMSAPEKEEPKPFLYPPIKNDFSSSQNRSPSAQSILQ